MNIFDVYQQRIAAVIGALGRDGTLPAGLDTARIVVEPPRDPAHGDLATNAAMVLAKDARMNPRMLAETIARAVQGEPGVVSAEVAGPGFINIRLHEDVLRDVVLAILSLGDGFGRLHPE